MQNPKFSSIAMVALLVTSANVPVLANDSAAQAEQAVPADTKFAQFAPKKATSTSKIDYGVWDDALKYFVFGMGKSIREGAPNPSPGAGTRRVYGHDSRYRLEGNRVVFSYMNKDVLGALKDYRADLEKTSDIVDISKLSKNEQLAYWINLHNVAVIEQIAAAYPVGQPSRIKIGEDKIPLDQAPFITVKNVKMSPHDIRTKIVYPNWNSPKIVYGFFRGDIGGPSIQDEAYNAENIGDLLDKSAGEFVNSLRGTQKSGKKLLVSKIYTEVQPYFFPDWQKDVKDHLRKFADDKVTSIINGATDVEARIYELDIADLANGERDPNYGYVTTDGTARGIKIPAAIGRLLAERHNKFKKLVRRGGLRGIVTIIDVDLPGEEVNDKEVK